MNARSETADSTGRGDRFERGQQIADRYEIDAVLGEGASGVVYRAHRLDREQTVALKVIHRHLCGDRQIFGRYHREASILKRLDGPHLARLLDFIEEDELLVIALEYVEGRTLESYLKDVGTVDTRTAIEIALQVCATLGVAHAAGIVHRDLKPANVMLELRPGERSDDGSSLHVRVVDFGLAKVVHGAHMTTGLTEHDMIFGTAEYMAPEQARGDEVDARTDIYAVGVMLYEMVAGRVPFSERTPIATMTAHLTTEPEPPRSVAPNQQIRSSFEAVILKAMAKEPDDRYPTARAFAEALAAARDQSVIKPASSAAHDDDDLEMGDTALNLDTKDLGHSATMPGPPAEAEPKPASSTPPGALARLEPAPAPSSKNGWWLLTLIAAIVAITLGLVLGGRP